MRLPSQSVRATVLPAVLTVPLRPLTCLLVPERQASPTSCAWLL
ncbi:MULTISPECIES: hypothetical protein [unclassified Lysobacter]|nr:MULTISPECIES: hypothetical protein [unclassified Lysobacter]